MFKLVFTKDKASYKTSFIGVEKKSLINTLIFLMLKNLFFARNIPDNLFSYFHSHLLFFFQFITLFTCQVNLKILANFDKIYRC